MKEKKGLDKFEYEIKEAEKILDELIEQRVDFAESIHSYLDDEDIITYLDELDKAKTNLSALKKLENSGCKIYIDIGKEDNFKGIVDVYSYKNLDSLVRLNMFVEDMMNLHNDIYLSESDGSIETFFKTYKFDDLDIKDIAESIRDLYFKLEEGSYHFSHRFGFHSVGEVLLNEMDKLLVREFNVDNVKITEEYELTNDGVYLSMLEESTTIMTRLGKVIKDNVYVYDESGKLLNHEIILHQEGTTLYANSPERNYEIFYTTHNGKKLTPEDIKPIES